MAIPPVGGGQPPQPPQEPPLKSRFTGALGSLIYAIRHVLRSGGVDDPEALSRFADAAKALNQPSIEAANLY